MRMILSMRCLIKTTNNLAVIPESMESAISREKELKKWRRKWKIELIEQMNRSWLDLYSAIV